MVSAIQKDVVMAEAGPVLSGGISGAMTGPEAGLTGFPRSEGQVERRDWLGRVGVSCTGLGRTELACAERGCTGVGRPENGLRVCKVYCGV